MVQVINNTQNLSVQPTQSQNKDATSLSMFGADGVEFTDLIDVVNPLHHIPVVNTVYRQISGDEIGVAPRLAGSTLFGGVIGLAASAINIGIEALTGRDVGEHAWNFVFTGDDPLEQDPTGAGSETDFAKQNGAPVPLNQPGTTAPTAANSTDMMPEGFVNLVNNKSWAAVGSDTAWSPGQGPVAINRPAPTEVAMQYQHQMAAPQPQFAQSFTQQATAATASSGNGIALMNKPPASVTAQVVNPARTTISSGNLPPVIANTVSPQPMNTRPAITPLASPVGQPTALGGGHVIPVPQPAAIEPEALSPVAAPGRQYTSPALPQVAAIASPGGITVSKNAPGMIPQPTALAPASSAKLSVNDLKPLETHHPAGDPARNPIPADLFSATEERYNAGQTDKPVFSDNAASGSKDSAYLVPDFKPSQVIEHQSSSPKMPSPLPPMMEANTSRTLKEVANSLDLPDWAAEANERENRIKTGNYRQNMSNTAGSLYGQASYSTIPGIDEAPSRITPKTWTGSNSGPGLL